MEERLKEELLEDELLVEECVVEEFLDDEFLEKFLEEGDPIQVLELVVATVGELVWDQAAKAHEVEQILEEDDKQGVLVVELLLAA